MLEAAYTVAKEKHQGPVWTVWKALEEAEWVFLSWHQFVRRNGTIMELKEASPGMVKMCYMEDVRNAKYDNWWFELSIKGAQGRKPDVAPIREWMSSTKVPRRNQLAGLRQFAGAVPTKSKLRSWGAQVDGAGEFCGQEDDLEHRLWKCSLTEELRKSLSDGTC